MATVSVSVSVVAIPGKAAPDALAFCARQTVKAKRSADGLTYQVWNDAGTAYTVVPAATFESIYAAMPVAAPIVPPDTTKPTSANNK